MKRLLGALVLASSSVLFLPLASYAAGSSGDLNHAESLYKEGKYKEALALLNTYIAGHPKDATALVDRGDDYEALGDPKSATADYSAAIEINPDYAYAYASRCDSRDELGQNRKALDDCDKAIGLDPKMAYAYRARARVHVHLNDSQAALADANNAISLASDNAFGFEIRCRVYVDLGEDAKAIDDCNEAIRIDPTMEEGYFQRGRANIDLKKWTDAIADFTQAEKIDEGPIAKYWLAVARLNNGDYDEGLRNIDSYIAAKSDDGDGYYVRAQIELKLGNRAEAKASAQDALRHYRIDGDQTGAQKAQDLLDSIGQG